MEKMLEHRINEHRGAHSMFLQKEDDRIRNSLAARGLLNSGVYFRESQDAYNKIISGFVDQYGKPRPGIANVYKQYFEEFPDELTEETLKEVLEYEDNQCKRAQASFPFSHTSANSDGVKRFWEQSLILLYQNIKSQIRMELEPILKRKITSDSGRRKVAIPDEKTIGENPQSIWGSLHAKVVEVSRRKFEDGYYADAVESAFKEINVVVKRKYFEKTGNESDGVSLMRKVFNPDNPVIHLDKNLQTESGRNIQDGYMQLFAGSMMGIRNPKAHANISIDEDRGIHFLYLASLLFKKLDESI